MYRKPIIYLLVFILSWGALPLDFAAAGMTIGEEREIGEKLLYKIRAEFNLIDDLDIKQYMDRLGREVVSKVGTHYFDYRFYVVPNDEFNAFAAPSGLIFFYTGLIETMKNENQLLSVMAHEIAHVESRHIASRTDKNVKVGAISMALAIASLALGDPSLAAGLFTGFQAAGQAASLHFSRLDEEQADRLSYEWMHALRRDPRDMEGMLRTMRRISRYRSDQIPPYLLTHPNPEARMEYVQSLLDYQEQKVAKDYYHEPDNFAFLRMKHRVMINASDPQKAREYFTRILAAGRDPEERMMASYGLAILHAKELNFSKALEELAKVQAFFPDRSILDVDAGIMHLDSGNLQKALELLESAYKANPDDMYAAFYLGQTYAKLGRPEAAGQIYLRVQQYMPEYPMVYFELGRIKSGQGNSGMSDYYLAKYYLYEGRLEFAREYLDRVKRNQELAGSMRSEADKLLKRLEELEKL